MYDRRNSGWRAATMAYAFMNMAVQVGRGWQSFRASTRARKFIRRSIATDGTCWLKCIKSITSRRNGLMAIDCPLTLPMVSPIAVVQVDCNDHRRATPKTDGGCTFAMEIRTNAHFTIDKV